MKLTFKRQLTCFKTVIKPKGRLFKKKHSLTSAVNIEDLYYPFLDNIDSKYEFDLWIATMF